MELNILVEGNKTNVIRGMDTHNKMDYRGLRNRRLVKRLLH